MATGAGAVLGLLIAAAMSTVVDAPRPFTDGTAVNYLDHVRDGSFPSDHATLASALAFGFWRRRPTRLPLAWMPLLVVAASIGWARVFLGAHYPSDILGGALLGAACALAVETPAGRVVLGPSQRLAERMRALVLVAWDRGRPDRATGARDR